MIKSFIYKIYVLCISILLVNSLNADDRYKDELIIQSTTSTRDSGFYNYILPRFEDLHKVKVKVVAYGTGQAINNAKNCNADILIVHSLKDEIKFIEQGYGTKRQNLMYNDFVIIGPKKDIFNISKKNNIEDIFRDFIENNIKFVSRGDDSGTHKAEREIWNIIKIDPDNKKYSSYYESGQGMGATINIAIGMNGYTFTDRATWLNFQNKSEHKILYENDDLLLNQYGIILVSKKKCPNVNMEASKLFYKWILSDLGKKLITEYKVNNEQLFFIK